MKSNKDQRVRCSTRAVPVLGVGFFLRISFPPEPGCVQLLIEDADTPQLGLIARKFAEAVAPAIEAALVESFAPEFSNDERYCQALFDGMVRAVDQSFDSFLARLQQTKGDRE